MSTAIRTSAGALLLLLITLLCFQHLSLACQGASNAAGGRYNAIDSSTKGSSEILERTKEDKIRGRKMMASDQFMTTEAEAEQISVAAKDHQKSFKNQIPKEHYGARFVAFNEDYRGPRHHPPKNN